MAGRSGGSIDYWLAQLGEQSLGLRRLVP